MIDIFHPIVDSLLKVEGVGSLEESRLERTDSREKALMDLAMAEVLNESDNRSDAEAAFFFETLEEARAALSLALGLGLVEGEVIFDNTVDPKWGLGRFAIRVEPIVVYSKPTIYQALVDGIAELAELDDSDLEMYGSPVEEEELFEKSFHDTAGEFTGIDRIAGKPVPKRDKDGKIVKKENGDIVYDSRDDTGTGKGSVSYGDRANKQSYSKNKGSTASFEPTFKSSSPTRCGRAARRKGAGKDYGRTCWDGKIPDWAKKESLSDLGDRLLEDSVPIMRTKKTDHSMALMQIKGWIAPKLRAHTAVYRALSKARPEGKVLRVKAGGLDLAIAYKDDRTIAWSANGAKGRHKASGTIQKVAGPILDAIKLSLDEDVEVEGMELTEDVANTILKQMGGWGRIRMMIGAKNAVSYKAKGDSKYGEGMGGVSFKFPRPGGSAASKRKRGRGMPNFVKIILNGKDLYDVTFGSIHGSSYKVTKEYKDVYAASLKDIFERETGLYLSF